MDEKFFSGYQRVLLLGQVLYDCHVCYGDKNSYICVYVYIIRVESCVLAFVTSLSDA